MARDRVPPSLSWLESLAVDDLLNTLSAGVAVFDARGRIVLWNTAAETITGYTAAEALGRTPEFLEGMGCAGFTRLTSLLRTGERTHEDDLTGMQCKVLVRDGRVARLFGNARVVRGHRGKKLGAMASFLDLSETDAAEARAEHLEDELRAERGFGKLIGASPAMKVHFRQIQQAAATDVTVLIQGESGTGKELAARAIHEASARAPGPFVAVHCSALPESLLESELFGHVKGAFTGAVRDNPGRFELAQGGTLFLDEIGELTPLIQVKLLRALEQREVERLGEGRPRPVDVRLVAATHRDLKQMVADGRMREDFFFRIRVFPLVVPPLRDRREDVPVLATHLLREIDRKGGRKRRGRPRGFTAAAMERLVRAPWPGNVRELRNAIEYACVVAESERIDIRDLPPDLEEHAGAVAGATAPPPAPQSSRMPDANEIEQALEAAGGRISEAARRLGISRVTLWRRRKRPERET